VEKLTIPVITIFLEVLDEFRGDFLRKVSELVSQRIHDILYRRDLSQRYVFERVDAELVRKEQHDSEKFFLFCGLE
jgi:hypothetical protein